MAKNNAVDAATKAAEGQAKNDHETAMLARDEQIREKRLDNEREMMLRQVIASSPGSSLIHPRDVIFATKVLRELVVPNGHRFKKWRQIANKLHDVEMLARDEIVGAQQAIDDQQSLPIDKPENVTHELKTHAA